MPLLDKLSEFERNQLLRMQLVPLINRTIAALGMSPMAREWDQYHNVLVTLVTTARQEIYDARKSRAAKDQDRPDEVV